MFDIIATAHAATASAAGTSADNSLLTFALPIIFVAVFYFMVWRPQAKRAKDQRTLLSNLAKGDEVVTSGGILGKITQLTDDFIVLALNDTVEIKIQRNAVVAVLPKGTMKAI